MPLTRTVFLERVGRADLQATCEGVESNIVGVTANPAPGGPDYPHQPTTPGLVVVYESDFSTEPSHNWTGSFAPALHGYHCSDPWIVPVDDLVGPKSPGKALRYQYTYGPTGVHAGGSPGRLRYWANATKPYTQYLELYWRAWLRIGEPVFENVPVGFKLGGYLGYGNPQQYGTEIILGCGYSGGGYTDSHRLYDQTEARLGLFQQGNVNRRFDGPNSHPFYYGRPQGIEIHFVLNSMQHFVHGPNWKPTAGSNEVYDDGILEMWLDNGDGQGMVRILYATNVAFRTPAAWSDVGRGDYLQGFNAAIWDPVFGGGCTCTYVNPYCTQEQVNATTWPDNAAHRTKLNTLLVDHLYVSGVPL